MWKAVKCRNKPVHRMSLLAREGKEKVEEFSKYLSNVFKFNPEVANSNEITKFLDIILQIVPLLPNVSRRSSTYVTKAQTHKICQTRLNYKQNIKVPPKVLLYLIQIFNVVLRSHIIYCTKTSVYPMSGMK